MDDHDDYGALMERLATRVRTVPPRCLSGLQPIWASYRYSNGHEVEWTLACTCGCSRGKVLGTWVNFSSSRDPKFNHFHSPHAFVCAACDRTIEFFDVMHHGYDAEIMPNQTNPHRSNPGTGPREVFMCKLCKANEGTVVLRFVQQHFEPFDEHRDWEPRVQDFFDGMDIRLTCASCQSQSLVSSYELA